jgi:Ca2+/H+ antiporter
MVPAMRMTGSQIIALIVAILLLIPGGCFVLVGIALTKDDYRQHLSAFEAIADTAALWVLVAVILAPAALLFWVAFRRRR